MQEAGALGHSMATLSHIDADEHLYRKVTQSTRDLGTLTQERQREISYYLYDTNPFAKRVINQTRDFVAVPAEQWSIEHEDEELNAIVKRFWSDPINAWVKRLPDRVKELGLAGEQCYTLVTGKDGIVRVGYVDPAFIFKVNPDARNREIIESISLKEKNLGEPLALKVVNYDLDEGRMVGLDRLQQADGDGEFVGQCMFWALNKPTNATRGRSDLFVLADTLGMLDDFHWNRMEKSALANSFVWDVLCKNMNEAQIKEYAKSQNAPRPGTARFHNENVEWQAVAPSLNAEDASADARMFRIPVTAGSGIPEMWLFGVGEDANRASAYEMVDPPMRMMAERQAFVVGMIVDIVRYQIDMAIEIGKAGMIDDPAERYNFSINVPEISSRDMSKAATSYQSVTTATALNVEQGFLSRETAVGVIAFTTSQLGYDVVAEQEIERMEAEDEEQAEKDLLNPPQLPPDPVVPEPDPQVEEPTEPEE
jgi:hypothetical protein